MGAFEWFPYTNFQTLNLNEIYRLLKNLDNELDDVKKQIAKINDDIKDYIVKYVNELVETGVLFITLEYDSPTEALTLVLSKEDTRHG